MNLVHRMHDWDFFTRIVVYVPATRILVPLDTVCIGMSYDYDTRAFITPLYSEVDVGMSRMIYSDYLIAGAPIILTADGQYVTLNEALIAAELNPSAFDLYYLEKAHRAFVTMKDAYMRDDLYDFRVASNTFAQAVADANEAQMY